MRITPSIKWDPLNAHLLVTSVEELAFYSEREQRLAEEEGLGRGRTRTITLIFNPVKEWV
jgi:hypothetical protein